MDCPRSAWMHFAAASCCALHTGGLTALAALAGAGVSALAACTSTGPVRPRYSPAAFTRTTGNRNRPAAVNRRLMSGLGMITSEVRQRVGQLETDRFAGDVGGHLRVRGVARRHHLQTHRPHESIDRIDPLEKIG